MATQAERMEATRTALIAAARSAFAKHGYANASMDDICAAAGVTRGALYHNFGDKKGLLMAVVDEMDAAMATRAEEMAADVQDDWDRFLASGIAYIEMALDPDVQRIVLLDGPAVLGDPSRWASQNACLRATIRTLERLTENRRVKAVDPEAAARLLNSAALDGALWIAASEEKEAVLERVTDAFKCLAEGLLVE